MAKRLVSGGSNWLTLNMAKSARQGRIFIDYHRNSRGATAVAAYSTRAKPSATVSVPLSWDELPRCKGPAEFTLLNLRERLRTLNADPWAEMATLKQGITAKAAKLLRR